MSNKLTKCYRCNASYDPEEKWVYGYYDNTSTTTFYVTEYVEEKHCPICRKPPLLIKPQMERGVM